MYCPVYQLCSEQRYHFATQHILHLVCIELNLLALSVCVSAGIVIPYVASRDYLVVPSSCNYSVICHCVSPSYLWAMGACYHKERLFVVTLTRRNHLVPSFFSCINQRHKGKCGLEGGRD